MLKIEVVSQRPAEKPDQILAVIDLGDHRPLVNEASLKSHPGWADLQRRRKAGEIGGAYLTASSPAMLYLPGRSAKHYPDHEKIKTLAAQALASASDRRAGSLVVVLDGPEGASAAPLVAEGMCLYHYDFGKYRKDGSTKRDAPAIEIVVPEASRKQAQAEVKKRLELCGSVNRARDLINEPGSVATPAEIEARAREVAEKNGLKITVLDEKQLRKEGYEGLLAVGRGGRVPPRMIVMEYAPAGSKGKRKLGLLGKGVTFDTGGVSIKPAGKMWEMKGDMSGAAAVIYAMEAIARAKPKLAVTAIIVTAQNYVDANAIVPGDVIKGRNGKFIHVDNTDAEGRLILSDGMWRAGEEKVTHLIDFATLTGAVVRALGTSISGGFGNDDLVDRFIDVARSCGEDCWKLPLYDEYIEMLKFDMTDINNVSGKVEAGAITAALFLREFLPEGISWAHMDIAGTFLVNSKWKYFRAGGTGVMVRSIATFAQAMADGVMD